MSLVIHCWYMCCAGLWLQDVYIYIYINFSPLYILYYDKYYITQQLFNCDWILDLTPQIFMNILSYQLALLLKIEIQECYIMDVLVKRRKHNYHVLCMELISVPFSK